MYRGTTPTYTFILPDEVDLTLASAVYVTFSDIRENIIYTKTGSDLDVMEHSVSVYLTQEETLRLPGSVKCQLNWLYSEGTVTKRACSQIIAINTKRNLIDRELTDHD